MAQEHSPRQRDAGPFLMKVRFTPFLGQWALTKPFPGIPLIGLSVLAEVERLWAVEAGAVGLITSIKGLGYDVFLRAAFVPIVRDWRDARGSGWVLQANMLAGFRRLFRYDAPDGHPGTELTHGVRVNGGYELTRNWFTVRFLTGLTVPVAQTRTQFWAEYNYFSPSDDLGLLFDVGLDFGIAR